MPFAATFLGEPDLFPARPGGELWGDRALLVRLAGGYYRFQGLTEGQLDAIYGRLAAPIPDTVPERDDVLPVRVYRAAGSQFRQPESGGWEYALDVAYDPSSVRIAGLALTGRLDWRPRLEGSFWTSAEAGDPFYGAFENYLRVLESYRMLEARGALLHSAAVVWEGRALVFLGRSGAGKSTLSRLASERGLDVLSDDLNALREAEGRLLAEQVPFCGDFRAASMTSSRYPVAAIFRLRKAQNAAVRPLGSAEALASLLAAATGLGRDPYRRRRLLLTLERVAASVPVFELGFSLDGAFWPLLDGVSRA